MILIVLIAGMALIAWGVVLVARRRSVVAGGVLLGLGSLIVVGLGGLVLLAVAGAVAAYAGAG